MNLGDLAGLSLRNPATGLGSLLQYKVAVIYGAAINIICGTFFD